VTKLLLISGSLRGGSTNSATMRTAAVLAPPGVEAAIYDGMGRLPHFSPDDDPTDGVGLDAEVAALRAALAEADALLLSTPEYAGALPGSFKNLLDWTVGGGQTYEMPVAWINVSGAAAPSGGADAHDSLRKVLGYTGSRIVEEAVLRLPLSRDDVGEDGLITPPAAREQIVSSVTALAAASD
jgi:chromate reductase, NAD(P)H dehydrogenase (quinone)